MTPAAATICPLAETMPQFMTHGASLSHGSFKCWLRRCFTFSLRDVKYHTPFEHFRRGHAEMRAILRDPILGLL